MSWRWYGAVTAILVTFELVRRRRLRRRRNRLGDEGRCAELVGVVREQALPAGVVDLDAFDHNLDLMASAAHKAGKKVRVATKSLRCPFLIERAARKCGGRVMCYSIHEAEMLAAEKWCTDILIGYPMHLDSTAKAALRRAQQHTTVTVMVDCVEQLEHLVPLAPLRVCIDLDCSLQLPFVHFGARRSPANSLAHLQAMLDTLQTSSRGLTLAGVMMYEAQIAGIPDANPFVSVPYQGLINFLRWWSARDVAARRKRVASLLADRDLSVDFFNAGGTGSIGNVLKEGSHVTEVTVGSGLLQPTLFDLYYDGAARRPALFFAIPVTRIPRKGWVCCQSGGFPASGSPGVDKSPVAVYPVGTRVSPHEGFGEVQTAFTVKRAMAIGDVVLCRPAKAGELAERFAEYTVVEGGHIAHHVTRVKTYRGLGYTFF